MKTPTTTPLGESVFNYSDEGEELIHPLLPHLTACPSTAATNSLGDRPGEHTVTDYLRTKGIQVETMDNDPALFPDHSRDTRQPFALQKKFNVVVASEVFEHSNQVPSSYPFKHGEVLNTGGHLVVSVPYSTIRLLPRRTKYGRFVSCEGRLMTHIPYWFFHPIIVLARALYRFQKGRKPYFRWNYFTEFPDNEFNVHHWDVGTWPTTIKAVSRVFEEQFAIVSCETSVRCNAAYWVLAKK